jgi:hypothetical protein
MTKWARFLSHYNFATAAARSPIFLCCPLARTTDRRTSINDVEPGTGVLGHHEYRAAVNVIACNPGLVHPGGCGTKAPGTPRTAKFTSLIGM